MIINKGGSNNNSSKSSAMNGAMATVERMIITDFINFFAQQNIDSEQWNWELINNLDKHIEKFIETDE